MFYDIFRVDSEEDKEPVSGILNIYNTGEIIYRVLSYMNLKENEL